MNKRNGQLNPGQLLLLWGLFCVSCGNPLIKPLLPDPQEVEPVYTGPVLVKTITLAPLTLAVSETVDIAVTIAPSNAANQALRWSSGNTIVAAVDPETGDVTGKQNGTAIITAAAQDGSGVTGSVTVTVGTGVLDEAYVKITAITLENLTVTAGADVQEAISYTIAPADADYTDLDWESSDPAIATVSSEGEITGKKAGTVTITAKAQDGSGVKGTCTVTVNAAAAGSGGDGPGEIPGGETDPVDTIAVQTVTLTGTTIYVNQTTVVSASVLPAEASDKGLTWASSDSATVTVDQTGKVTGKRVGSATITATAKDGSGKSGTCTVTVTAPPAGQIVIIEYQGWLETAFVKWQEYTGAESYNVYYKGGAVSSYTKIDDQLIRKYANPAYYRADVLGLAAGSYQLKITAVIGGQETGAAETDSVTVTAHDRSGFGFADGKIPGAYKMDGTLKANARILYITDVNKASVTLAVKKSASAEESAVGLQNIVKLYEKGYEDRPLAVRFIGQVTANLSSVGTNGGFTDSEGTIMIKGNNSRGTTEITFEGVGNDATAYGWGFRSSSARLTEIRNLGIMYVKNKQLDGIEFQKSSNMWVHNCDIFYAGASGSDADQAKGDGAFDMKECDNVTASYIHYWDTGKSNLMGNGTEPAGHLTFHHNWYDHSDSRHPRVRFHTTHVYNNLYDGVSKYGIGAAKGGPSIFVEANYFQNSKNPMLISMQGTDIAGGDGGTFSSEDGGVIKAYNNYLDAKATSTFRPWSASNTVEFDAYVVENRNDTVPSTVKAKKGGATYNNFDTASDFYTYTADSPVVARDKVKEYAGRYWHSDFSWTWTEADNTSSAVNTALKTALANYQCKLVSIQGDGAVGTEPETEPGTDPDPDTGSGIEGDVVCHFTGSTPSSSLFSITGNYSNSKGSVTVNGTTYSICLKMESSTVISFTLSEPMTLKLYFGGSTAAGGKAVKIDDVNKTTAADGTLTVTLNAGAHTVKKGDPINLFYISLTR